MHFAHVTLHNNVLSFQESEQHAMTALYKNTVWLEGRIINNMYNAWVLSHSWLRAYI